MEIIPEITLLTSIIVGFILFKVSFGALTLHNPAALFFLGHVLLLGIGGLYRNIYADTVPINDIVIYLVALSLLQYAAGAYCGTRVFYTKRICSRSVLENPFFNKPLAYAKSNAFVLITTLVPVIFLLVFSIKANEFIWLMDDMDNARMEIRKGLGAIVLLGIASSFVSSILFIHHAKPRLFVAVLAILLFSFMAGFYGNRAPAGYVFISSLYYYFGIKERSSKTLFLLISIVIFMILMALNIIRQGLDVSILSALQQTLWRPFVNFQNLNIIYEDFYLRNDIQYGSAYLRDLAIFFPGVHQNNAEWIKEYLGMNFSGGGVTITYIGELILNFSIESLLVAPFILGFMLQLLFVFMLRVRCSVPFMLLVSFSCMGMVSSGFIPPVINMLAPLLIVYFGLVALRFILVGASNGLGPCLMEIRGNQ